MCQDRVVVAGHAKELKRRSTEASELAQEAHVAISAVAKQVASDSESNDDASCADKDMFEMSQSKPKWQGAKQHKFTKAIYSDSNGDDLASKEYPKLKLNHQPSINSNMTGNHLSQRPRESQVLDHSRPYKDMEDDITSQEPTKSEYCGGGDTNASAVASGTSDHEQEEDDGDSIDHNILFQKTSTGNGSKQVYPSLSVMNPADQSKIKLAVEKALQQDIQDYVSKTLFRRWKFVTDPDHWKFNFKRIGGAIMDYVGIHQDERKAFWQSYMGCGKKALNDKRASVGQAVKHAVIGKFDILCKGLGSAMMKRTI